jgi:hypothetical protein
MSAKRIQWMWENDQGTGYNNYDEPLNILLEFFFTRRHVDYNGISLSKVEPPIPSFIIPYRQFMWIFNFDEMTQRNEGSASERKIIRVVNGKVWIWYKLGKESNFYSFNDISIVAELDSRIDRGGQRGLKSSNREFTYVSKKPNITLTCNLLLYNETHMCNNDIIIQYVDLGTLQSYTAGAGAGAAAAAAAAAPPYQPLIAPAVTQPGLYLPPGWVTLHDSVHNMPLYLNNETGERTYTRPQGGGKIGKKKRIIKRQKTYKKRYPRGKTIKR